LALGAISVYEDHLRFNYKEALFQYENAKEIWSKQRADVLRPDKSAKNRTAQAAKQELEALGAAPNPPPIPMLKCPEPTFEGLFKLLQSGHPSIGVFTDEGGQFIGGHGMNADNKLRTATGLSSAWDGSPIKRVRAVDGAITLTGRRVAMHLMVQPGVAELLLGDQVLESQGLLSRVLVAAPESTSGTRFWQEPNAEDQLAIDVYKTLLLKFLNQPYELLSNEPNELNPPVLKLSPDARIRWISGVNQVERRLGAGGEFESIRGFANKLMEHATRLAAIVQLVKNPMAECISDSCMASGIELAEYYASEAVRVFSTSNVRADLALAQKLIDWLDKKWDEDYISPAEICQLGPNQMRDIESAKRYIKLIEEYGWLIPRKEGATIRGKRRKQAWQIVRVTNSD